MPVKENIVKKLMVIALLLATAFAYGADSDAPQHFDFTHLLIGVNGKPIPQDSKTAEPLTLGDAAVIALEAALDEDRSLPGVEKFKRDQLARKIYQKKDVTLSLSEATLIFERIGKVWSPNVVGAAWPFLDPTYRNKK
jgi:hypothetical protein